jgi:hypothetical protein
MKIRAIEPGHVFEQRVFQGEPLASLRWLEHCLETRSELGQLRERALILGASFDPCSGLDQAAPKPSPPDTRMNIVRRDIVRRDIVRPVARTTRASDGLLHAQQTRHRRRSRWILGGRMAFHVERGIHDRLVDLRRTVFDGLALDVNANRVIALEAITLAEDVTGMDDRARHGSGKGQHPSILILCSVLGKGKRCALECLHRAERERFTEHEIGERSIFQRVLARHHAT